MIIYLTAASAAAIYALLYSVHCFSSGRIKAGAGALSGVLLLAGLSALMLRA